MINIISLIVQYDIIKNNHSNIFLFTIIYFYLRRGNSEITVPMRLLRIEAFGQFSLVIDSSAQHGNILRTIKGFQGKNIWGCQLDTNRGSPAF